ncbi:TIGR03086 family protein [Streptomyces sp. ERV7]|uniref:TIGR03086 family metal-binding protein n=1 Tax=Streptomyces sp. ERV7 TaxID=1322334 RepID=UPI0007F4E6F4|nr:TIGR03086 family metal-binding protein [Streptomyces sp. ERV7]OAR22980.1 TIGR03086 family protein [Streptomyces sp. ERV7]
MASPASSDHARLLGLHREAVALFGSRVHAVRPDQWDLPTPCAEWSVRDLVNHLAVEQLWVAPLVAEGRTIADVGDAFDGDVLGAGPVGVWDTAVAAAVAAFAEPGALDGTVHLSYGKTPAAAYCSQMVADAVVHSWDLSRAIGADERLPDALVEAAAREFGGYADQLPPSMFDAPVEVPDGADAQTRLLAMLGRSV